MFDDVFIPGRGITRGIRVRDLPPRTPVLARVDLRTASGRRGEPWRETRVVLRGTLEIVTRISVLVTTARQG